MAGGGGQEAGQLDPSLLGDFAEVIGEVALVGGGVAGLRLQGVEVKQVEQGLGQLADGGLGFVEGQGAEVD